MFWSRISHPRSFSILVLGAKRTPIGFLTGKLSKIPGCLLCAYALSAAKTQAHVSHIDEVVFGTAVSAGQGMNPARQVALAAGLSGDTVATTVSKGESSGLKAITIAAETVELNKEVVVAAGGFENCSLAPHMIRQYRLGSPLGSLEVQDCLLVDGLQCPVYDVPLGIVAEKTAVKYDILRRDQDAHSKESHIRAMSAWERGFFLQEVEPIDLSSTSYIKEVVRQDEYPSRIDFESIRWVEPMYMTTGSVTGANSSTIGDGAATLILAHETRAQSIETEPLARILAWTDSGSEPDSYSISIVTAIEKLLKKASFPLEKVDLFEIDENISITVLAVKEILKLSGFKVNVNGGAAALGNPLGMTGARMAGTLIYALKERKLKYGVVATCEGGGGATAMLMEVV